MTTSMFAAQENTALQEDDFDIVAAAPSIPFDFSRPPNLVWIENQAREGDPYYQGLLGWFNYRGYFIAKNNTNAAYWFQQSAEQGHPFGLYGRTVVETNLQLSAFNKKRLFESMTDMAEQGDAEAQMELGRMFNKGFIQTNMAVAFNWYQQSAEQEYAYAQAILAICHEKGIGTKKNNKEAFQWYRQAAEQGYARAQYDLGWCYKSGIGISKDKSKAIYWFRKAAEQGNAESQLYLGMHYLFGFESKIGFKNFLKFVTRDKTAGIYWVRKAAEQGNIGGCLLLAGLYAMNSMGFNDLKEAKYWLRQAEKIDPDNAFVKELTPIFSTLTALTQLKSGKFSPQDAASALVKYRFVVFILGGVYLIMGLLMVMAACYRERIGLIMAEGWIILYFTGQFFAQYALFFYVKHECSIGLIIAIMFTVAALPIMVGCLCGRQRHALWKWPSREGTVSAGKLVACYVFSGFCVMIGVESLYDLAFTWLTGASSPIQPTAPLIQSLFSASPFLTVISVGVIGPVAEEVIFRGFLDNALQRHVRPFVSIMIVSLVFSLIHFQAEFIPQLFFVGFVLGWVKVRTGTLWAPVLLHVLNNIYMCYLLGING